MKDWNPRELTISFAGIVIDSGYADGEFLTIEGLSDDYTDQAGTDGEVTRSKTNDHRATVTLKLMQTADANVLLSAIRQGDLDAPNGAGVGALIIRDRQGSSLYKAAEAWLVKLPPASFDRTATAREWTIRCADLASTTGGN
jgi:hypothetical protein